MVPFKALSVLLYSPEWAFPPPLVLPIKALLVLPNSPEWAISSHFRRIGIQTGRRPTGTAHLHASVLGYLEEGHADLQCVYGEGG